MKESSQLPPWTLCHAHSTWREGHCQVAAECHCNDIWWLQATTCMLCTILGQKSHVILATGQWDRPFYHQFSEWEWGRGGERKPREGKQISQGHRAESSNHYLGTQIIQHSDCNVGIKKSFPFITYCKVLEALYTFSHWTSWQPCQKVLLWSPD